MKKFMLIFTFVLGIHVYAACLVDYSGENICTSKEQNIQPFLLQHENSINNIEKTNQQTLPNLTPLNISPNNKTDKLQNSSCQFGICLQDINNSNNKN